MECPICGDKLYSKYRCPMSPLICYTCGYGGKIKDIVDDYIIGVKP